VEGGEKNCIYNFDWGVDEVFLVLKFFMRRLERV